MDQTDRPKVGVLEQPIHDPHNVRQDALLDVERGHQQRNVRRALVVRNNQRALVQGRRDVVAHFNHYKYLKNLVKYDL